MKIFELKKVHVHHEHLGFSLVDTNLSSKADGIVGSLLNESAFKTQGDSIFVKADIGSDQDIRFKIDADWVKDHKCLHVPSDSLDLLYKSSPAKMAVESLFSEPKALNPKLIAPAGPK